MNQGQIVFLNGVTSSGKTSIVEAIQSRSPEFFYVVANDLFEETIGERYLREDYWKYLSEAIIMMYHTAKLFSDHGKHVLIDGIIVERPGLTPHYEKVKEIFSGYPLSIVEVFCPLDICRQRNLAREHRSEDQSEEQHKLMARDIGYSYRVDTHENTSEECADLIVGHLFGKRTGE
ncbi:phosphotransferase-like protein [Paenibacillus sp. FSL H3-0333]|uniref:phosphotransferase-like protein n=1 Tax=Paenibacillus sp. FSL H3-0333 TaxID=2921373 RepID=UPI0030FCB12F